MDAQHIFDDDDDDDEDESNHNNTAAKQGVSSTSERPEENGVLQFHEGTEDALLVYVRNQHPQRSAANVLNAVDAFCWKRHWMMHCGPHKGAILQTFLAERYRDYYTVRHDHSEIQQPIFIIVEIGSYCGYSAICMAQKLFVTVTASDNSGKPAKQERGPTTPPPFHIYSIDVHPKLLQIATEMTRLAGMEHCISHHLLRYNNNNNTNNNNNNDEGNDSSLHKLLHEILAKNEPQPSANNNNSNMIHFCLLDHDKDMYLKDLQQMERYGWLRRGSAVAADNVIFANIDEYRQYVQSAENYMSTRLVESPLEYQTEIPDGIELSVYLQNPPTTTMPVSR